MHPTGNLTIDHKDTRWLKITNHEEGGPNSIRISGTAKINGVKITSWNLTIDDVIRQNKDDSIPRPYIRVERGAGAVDISNSEIAFLGYNPTQALAYRDGGNGSTLSNNIFHDMWFGFYSDSVGFITISNNHYYNNSIYAIDPHTGSHDFKIINNNIYNSGIGAICSLDCFNILFEGNNIFGGRIGIMFSRNTTDSIARNNYVYGAEREGIVISESNQNSVFDNTIDESNIGIYVHSNSSGNYIHDNSVNGGISGLTIRDVSTNSNLFENNNLSGMDYAVRVNAADAKDNLFVSNKIGSTEEYEYYVSHNGNLQIRNQTFTNDKIRGGSGFNIVDIFGSGQITGGIGEVNTDSFKHITTLSGTTVMIDSENLGYNNLKRTNRQ